MRILIGSCKWSLLQPVDPVDQDPEPVQPDHRLTVQSPTLLIAAPTVCTPFAQTLMIRLHRLVHLMLSISERWRIHAVSPRLCCCSYRRFYGLRAPWCKRSMRRVRWLVGVLPGLASRIWFAGVVGCIGWGLSSFVSHQYVFVAGVVR